MKTDTLTTIEHLWSLVCEKSVIDTDTNNVSLNNIIETIQITKRSLSEHVDSEKGFIIPLNYEIIALLKKSADPEKEVRAEAKLELVDPNEKILQKLVHEFTIASGTERFRWRAKAQGLAVTVPGDYYFKLSIREDGKAQFIPVNDIYLQIKMAVEQ